MVSRLTIATDSAQKRGELSLAEAFFVLQTDAQSVRVLHGRARTAAASCSPHPFSVSE